MARITFLATIALLSLLTSSAVWSGTFSHGKLMYNTYCTKCHSSKMHIRKKRLAKDKAGIRKQVLRWQTNNNLTWTQNDIDSVVLYLNKMYYKFK